MNVWQRAASRAAALADGALDSAAALRTVAIRAVIG